MRLTIDKDLMNQVPPVKGMTILQRWKKEGRLELFEAEPSPDRPPQVVAPTDFTTRHKPQNSRSSSGKSAFAKLAPVVFPFRDKSRLNMTEVNDVAHIARHSQSGNEYFVTGNESLIGRRERLALHGVIAMTPEEAVKSIARNEGWK
jgi:hypothetical protein